MIKSDYIILGAGASGLMLAYRMAQDAFFDDKSIIIIDKQKDKGNDRTWCFWEIGSGEWDAITFKTWDTIYFGSKWFSKKIDTNPYTYKMIKSGAFYKLIWDTISKKSNIEFRHAAVDSIQDKGDKIIVNSSLGEFEGTTVFNSLPLNKTYLTQAEFPVLQQHFVGWFIKTSKPQFDDSMATFMDFHLPQKNNTRFMYVLPTSPTTALFEYTLFSKDLLPLAEYESEIKAYLTKIGVHDYDILEKEQGAIPMTCYDFLKENSKNLLHIGTAGGWTKSSTGYTFRNTSKETKLLVAFLKHNTDMSKFARRNKFWYYDLLLLDVLSKDNKNGAKLFSSLFKKTKLTLLFKFLDEETTVIEDLKIMSAVPILKFNKALFKRLF